MKEIIRELIKKNRNRFKKASNLDAFLVLYGMGEIPKKTMPFIC